jgi:hypothetical protein
VNSAPQVPAGRTARILMGILAVLAVFLGVTSTGWMVLLVRQWALPWSTLAVTGHAPPRWEQRSLPAPNPPQKN